MAGYGKPDAFALQTGMLAQVVTENLRTVDQFLAGNIIPWIDLGDQSVYHQEQVSSYGSTEPTAQAASADITFSNVVPAKTSQYLKNTVVGAKLPLQFINDPKQLMTQISKKGYRLGQILATQLASTGVATDTNFGGLGSFCTPTAANTGQSISAGGAALSGAISVPLVRTLISRCISPTDSKVLVMNSRTYINLLTALEALSWSYQTAQVGFGPPVTLFDGKYPILVNDFIPITDGDVGAVAVGTRIYCVGLNPDFGFAGIYGSGGPAFTNQDLNAFGGAVRMRLVDDSNSTQVNLQLWANINFILQEKFAMSQLVGVSN